MVLLPRTPWRGSGADLTFLLEAKCLAQID
jgi:hypothetical protein